MIAARGGRPSRDRSRSRRWVPIAAAALLGACGGGDHALVGNPALGSSQLLSYAYFQQCVEPIFNEPLPVTVNGAVVSNTCSASGCHDARNGPGGAFRVIATAQPVLLPSPPATFPVSLPGVIRASDMYRNYLSALGESVPGSPATSRLFQKPQLLGVQHGGGLILPNPLDPKVAIISYWISHPVPAGQDEFSTAMYGMFTPPDPNSGSCNTQ